MSINLELTNRRDLKNSALVSIGITFGGVISWSNNDSKDSTSTTLEVPVVYKKMERPVLLMTEPTLALKQNIYRITKLLIIHQQMR